MSTPEDLLTTDDQTPSEDEQQPTEAAIETPTPTEAPPTEPAPEPVESATEPASTAPEEPPTEPAPPAPVTPDPPVPATTDDAAPAVETAEGSSADAAAAADAPTDAEAEDTDDDEDEEDDGTGDFLFALGEWFVVHTYAGYENKVKANLASRIQSMNMEDKIYEVIVPTEEVMELKSGKMQSVQKKVFPGYILVRMNLDDDSWYVVRNTPGVTGFVGSGAKPTPLDPSEVQSILAPKAEERPRPKLEYEEGEVVSVVGGAFNGYSGPVSAIDMEKQIVTVMLDLFGRETRVEVAFDQVTKL